MSPLKLNMSPVKSHVTVVIRFNVIPLRIVPAHFYMSQRYMRSTISSLISNNAREKQILVIWIYFNLLMAGVPGKAVVRLPFGLCIKRSALIRAFLLFSLSFSFYKGMHLLLMMGGNDLWNAIAPFLSGQGRGSTPNPGQDPTGSSNLLVAAVAGDQPQSPQESRLAGLMELPGPTSSEIAGIPSPISRPAAFENVGCSTATSGSGTQNENTVSAEPSNANAFSYDENHTIGGDSVASIRHRILSKKGDISFEEAHYLAEDLFEIKAKIIQEMARWDVDGDWMNRGARALDNPSNSSKTGEYPLHTLYGFHDDLKDLGPMSNAFASLKDRVLRKRP